MLLHFHQINLKCYLNISNWSNYHIGLCFRHASFRSQYQENSETVVAFFFNLFHLHSLLINFYVFGAILSNKEIIVPFKDENTRLNIWKGACIYIWHQKWFFVCLWCDWNCDFYVCFILKLWFFFIVIRDIVNYRLWISFTLSSKFYDSRCNLHISFKFERGICT